MKTESKEEKDSRLILIDFYATWCGPCQTMEPILERVSHFFYKKLKVLRIDTDENRPVTTRFNIKSVPTFILLKEGKPIWRQSGLLSERDLKIAIRKHL